MGRKILFAALALVGVLPACNRVDEDLQPVGVVADAPVLSNPVVTSERVRFAAAASCGLPDYLEFKVTVVTVSADVAWLAEGTCFQGAEPGSPCRNDGDCDDTVDDVTEEVIQRGICGQPGLRLVFASAVTDPKTGEEEGVVMFDNGDELVPVFSSDGTQQIGDARTGDEFAGDGRYTREFAFQDASLIGTDALNRCMALALDLTAIKFVKKEEDEVFIRIDAVDGITGSAKLSVLQGTEIPGNPIPLESTECFNTLLPPDDQSFPCQ